VNSIARHLKGAGHKDLEKVILKIKSAVDNNSEAMLRQQAADVGQQTKNRDTKLVLASRLHNQPPLMWLPEHELKGLKLKKMGPPMKYMLDVVKSTSLCNDPGAIKPWKVFHYTTSTTGQDARWHGVSASAMQDHTYSWHRRSRRAAWTASTTLWSAELSALPP
jgi:hypothetical protein